MKLEAYKNISGKSGVTHYALGDGFIEVKFNGQPQMYVYTEERCGKNQILQMQVLALVGKGLATYISQHPQVRNNYVLKG